MNILFPTFRLDFAFVNGRNILINFRQIMTHTVLHETTFPGFEWKYFSPLIDLILHGRKILICFLQTTIILNSTADEPKTQFDSCAVLYEIRSTRDEVLTVKYRCDIILTPRFVKWNLESTASPLTQ